MILLYRSGLFLEVGHSDLLDQITAAAVRHRVSFFTLDSRGLEARVPVEDRKARYAWGVAGPRPPPRALGLPEARKQEVNGLMTLARSTGGRSVVDSNDMSAILRSVLEESSHYYVLGYAPRNTRERGRFRELKVSVSRPGVELRAPRGYYERKPFDRQSEKERSVALYRTLLSEKPVRLPGGGERRLLRRSRGPDRPRRSAPGVRPGTLVAKDGPEARAGGHGPPQASEPDPGVDARRPRAGAAARGRTGVPGGRGRTIPRSTWPTTAGSTFPRGRTC